MEIRIKIPVPEDPARRALLVTIVVSLLLHVVLLAGLVWTGPFSPSLMTRRGEPLLVDIVPDKPEDKAPRGDPSRPVAPETPPARAPEAPRPRVAQAPPAPRAAPPPRPAPPREAPRPGPEAPKPTPEPPKAPEPPKETAVPEPEPPREVARAVPPEPAKPAPEPLAQAPEPAPTARGAAPAAAPRPGPPAPPTPPGQTALATPRAVTPPGMWRGGGLDRGRGGVEGEPVPLDTPEPRYQDYFNKIRQRIKSHWTYPREAGDRGIQGDLQIEFHIAKDGRLAFIELRRSSGVDILDTAAMNAVRLAQPFPPVPDDIARQALAINGLFRYQIVGASLLNHYIR